MWALQGEVGWWFWGGDRVLHGLLVLGGMIQCSEGDGLPLVRLGDLL
jgi:hypothetical protein